MADTLVEVQTDLEEISVDPIPSNEPHGKTTSPAGSSSGLIKGQPFEQRLDPNSEVQQFGHISKEPKNTGTTGIAFSGGGIRSAAFCSGALRRMLQDEVPLEYLSCVSGGGYTGAAFLDWKKRRELRRENKVCCCCCCRRESGTSDHDEDWHKVFFEEMRNNAGYMCNWQSPLQGICHSIYFTLLLIFVVIILPFVLWLPYAFPVAVFVDVIFGGILRQNSTCPPSVSIGAKTSFLILELYDDCQPPGRRVALFVTTFVFWVFFFVLSRITYLRKCRNMFRFLSILNGLVLSLTFFPWVTHDFLWPLRTWIKVVVFIFLILLPFCFPIVRNVAAIFFFFYIYTFVVSWRVFKAELFGLLPYSDEVFYPILIGCAIAIILFTIIGPIHQSAFNIYYRFVLTLYSEYNVSYFSSFFGKLSDNCSPLTLRNPRTKSGNLFSASSYTSSRCNDH